MKGVYVSNNKTNKINIVYNDEIKKKISEKITIVDPIVGRHNLEEHKGLLEDVEVIFSTWGMENFTVAEIKTYFPKLKEVYYAAGSVQFFAKNFIDLGINVYSAWQANAIPVAEYTFAQIVLASKGYFRASKMNKNFWLKSRSYCENFPGNYKSTVGIIGCGQIGSMVCEKLKTLDVNVLVFDPFITNERIAALHVKKAQTLEDLFEKSDVVSNHLANNPETVNMINYHAMSKMKETATFINTGRGAQVVEKDLLNVLKKSKYRTAVLDVTTKEPTMILGGLTRSKQVVLTPHIAGSMGNEVCRMAEYMVSEFSRVEAGEKPQYLVSAEMLKTMA